MKPDWKQTLHTYLLMTLGTALVSVGSTSSNSPTISPWAAYPVWRCCWASW